MAVYPSTHWACAGPELEPDTRHIAGVRPIIGLTPSPALVGGAKEQFVPGDVPRFGIEQMCAVAR